MPFTAAIFQPSFKWFKRTYLRLSRECPDNNVAPLLPAFVLGSAGTFPYIAYGTFKALDPS